jgi:2-keto-3-deoxy-L-rhamnonate aldolase RhmA
MGLDYVWIDLEHSSFDFHDVATLTCAARSVKLASVVRVPQNDPKSISKALECGADALILPDVRDAAAARSIVESAKFHPDGMRGLAGTDVRSRYGLVDLDTYMAESNAETALIAQVEHADAVEHSEAIAGVDGIDAIFVGKMDLSQSLGVPGRTGHPAVERATARVAEACRRQGKALGLGAGTPEDVGAAVAQGARFIMMASEIGLIRARLKELLARCRDAAEAETARRER